MSVAEIAPRGEEFERTPPHDLAAEQCVLGGMMLSKDAISDVLEIIRPQDHYRPAHQIVHEVILDLYGRGEPADAVTVAAELTKRGDIGRMGGAPYLHTLIASVPTAANAGYYARIVRERALLRRLVEVGTRIVQLGYSGDGDADDLVDRAEAEVYGVTERRVSDDYLPLSEIMPGALEEIEAIGSRGGALTGVPTGFADLDSLTNGLHPGQMIVIAARPALGKALALDTPLPTPTGWTTMGEVQVGEALIGADGRPVRVIAATEAMLGRPCYEVEFSTGDVIVADGQHQWLTWNRLARRATARIRGGSRRPVRSAPPAVVTTEQIAATLRCRTAGQRPNHAVPMSEPFSLPEADLPVPPYALGTWLGDDSAGAGFTTADPEIAMRAGTAGMSARAALRTLGVIDGKHIPVPYLRASQAQRRALLAGLLDTDGTVIGTGSIQLTTASRQLAEDVRELVQSLGYQCAMTAKPVRGRTAAVSTCYLLSFATADQVFELSRKQRLHKELLRQDPRRAPWRYIVDVRAVASRPVRCVQVDGPDQLYLASLGMIPTHNSTLALDLARAASVAHGLTSVIFSLEMSRNEITMRLLSAEARVPLHTMRTGQMGDEDWTRLARRMSEVVNAPLFIDDSPNMSMMEIRAKCRRLKQRNDLRLVIIDYLQLMTSPKRVENRQQEVSDMSRSLKLLAKELNVPVVAVAQLNRGPEQRTDKRPLLADLRESGCLTAETTLLRADTGAPVTLRALLDNGHDGVLVWSVDEQHRIVPAPVTNVFSAGVKDVYRLKLASGREVEASGNHPFLTFDGWQPLEQLTLGDRVAIPRRTPAPLGAGLGWTEGQLGLLAHLIADGRVKRIPEILYSGSEQEISLFLRRLWATDGCVWIPQGNSTPKIYYASTSRELADGLVRLLARLGIVACIRETGKNGGHRPNYHVIIADGPSMRAFCEDVGVDGRCGEIARELLAILDGRAVNTNVDTLPINAVALDSELLEAAATSEIYWDGIVGIDPLGARPVFDATVKGTHNFIADGIFAHNSIEQDSDMVILLHREDAYERESPRAGEADFIVAKHRNGPTATVTVAFQGHFSRFVDMAPL